MNPSDLVTEVQESLAKAAEEDNPLDHTIFYSNRAVTYAVLAVVFELVEIRKLLQEKSQRDG